MSGSAITLRAPHAAPDRYRRGLRTVFTGTLLALSVMALAIGILSHAGRLELEPVLSGSMRPTFQPGDLVAAWRVPLASLHTGEIIMFSPPGQTKREMHRIVTIKHSHGQTLITTKGDANRVKDPWGRIGLRGKYAYRLAAVIPKVGWVSQIPKNILVPLCLVLAGLVFLISALRNIFRQKTEDSPIEPSSQQSMTRGYFPQPKSVAPPTAVNNQEGCNVS
jgi:signal peptidase I